jgi:hypothetical protein
MDGTAITSDEYDESSATAPAEFGDVLIVASYWLLARL